MSELLQNETWSVSELSRKLKGVVEQFGKVRVQGEISGFTRAASGHCYLNLKDADAVLKVVIWKGVAGKLPLQPEDGMEVVVSGRLGTYEARSEYQLVGEYMELAGRGALLKLLQERKEKLTAEGLFDEGHKKPLPPYPQVIGVITSPTGAVIQDILRRLETRLPVRVLLYPAVVQGDSAAAEICRAIGDFNDSQARKKLGIPKPDLLIVARGGGSLEDLLPFNEEAMVRAVFASEIPVIAAIGHETDTSLIDLAADCRAPTPTAAAEIAVLPKAQAIEDIGNHFRILQTAVTGKLELWESRLSGLGRGLIHPKSKLDTQRQRLDHISEHLRKNMATILGDRLYRLQNANLPSKDKLLRTITERHRNNLDKNIADMKKSMVRLLENASASLKLQGQLLQNSDYSNTLKRGFAIVRVAEGDGWVARTTAAEVNASGGNINILFHDGTVDAVVGKKTPRPQPSKKPPTKAGEHDNLFD